MKKLGVHLTPSVSKERIEQIVAEAMGHGYDEVVILARVYCGLSSASMKSSGKSPFSGPFGRSNSITPRWAIL